MTTPACEETLVSESRKKADVAVAVRNAIKLSMSLIATWALAFVMRFQLPRHLGPVRFGDFRFCDSFTASFFVFVGLGIETYIQKEVSVRPKHASDFFGGVIVGRVLLSTLLTGAMLIVFAATGRSAELQLVLVVFALTQFLIALNSTLGAMLQAATKVGTLAFVNVASKIAWGIGVVLGIHFNMPLVVLAMPSLGAELLRTAVLWPAARREIDLAWRVRLTDTVAVLGKSVPFYINVIAISLGPLLGVTMLGFQVARLHVDSSSSEVGWYSAAADLAGLALLLSPVFGWVLMPLLSRAKQRSEEEFLVILRRALEGLLITAIPITLIIALGADFWVLLAFGRSFGPAAMSLQLLAPMFIVTYLAIVLAIGLILSERSWRLTTISLIGVAVQPVLSLLLVPMLGRIGPGYAGAGASLALIGQETTVTVLMAISIGRRVIDRRSVAAIGKSLGIAIAIVGLDRAMVRLGPARLAIDLVAYAAAAFTIGAVRVGDVRGLIQTVREGRRDRAAA